LGGALRRGLSVPIGPLGRTGVTRCAPLALSAFVTGNTTGPLGALAESVGAFALGALAGS
jgi:hypothetical protein